MSSPVSLARPLREIAAGDEDGAAALLRADILSDDDGEESLAGDDRSPSGFVHGILVQTRGVPQPRWRKAAVMVSWSTRSRVSLGFGLGIALVIVVDMVSFTRLEPDGRSGVAQQRFSSGMSGRAPGTIRFSCTYFVPGFLSIHD
jgi:hypothetical protein